MSRVENKERNLIEELDRLHEIERQRARLLAMARKLAEALKTCSERFHFCILGSGSDREFADIAVEDYRELLEAYDEATRDG